MSDIQVEIAKAICKTRGYTIVCNRCSGATRPPEHKCTGQVWMREARAAMEVMSKAITEKINE